MKRCTYPSVLSLLVALTLLLVRAPQPAIAAQTFSGDTVTVASNQTINDDVYSFGSTITIDGVVHGDVVAIGGTVTVNGTVTGSVNAAASSITISGKVDGSLRAVGGDITVDGRIGKDALIAGNTIDVAENAQLGRDLNVAARTATLSGHVGRNVEANVQTLHIGGTARVQGNLSYGSDKADVAPAAILLGTVKHTHFNAQWPGVWQIWSAGVWPGMLAFAWLRGLLSLSVLGLLFLWLAPSVGRRTVMTLGERPWASLGFGLAVLITVPIAAILAFILGVFIGGWWLVLLALAIYVIAIALSLPITGFFVGQWLLQRASTRDVWPAGAALILGLALLMLVSLAPILGALVVIAAVLFGLGALTLSLPSVTRHETKNPPQSQTDLRPVPNLGDARRTLDASSA